MITLGYEIQDFSNLELTIGRKVFSENSIFQYFILNFQNSIGNISPPIAPLWRKIKDSDTKIPGIIGDTAI